MPTLAATVVHNVASNESTDVLGDARDKGMENGKKSMLHQGIEENDRQKEFWASLSMSHKQTQAEEQQGLNDMFSEIEKNLGRLRGNSTFFRAFFGLRAKEAESQKDERNSSTTQSHTRIDRKTQRQTDQ